MKRLYLDYAQLLLHSNFLMGRWKLSIWLNFDSYLFVCEYFRKLILHFFDSDMNYNFRISVKMMWVWVYTVGRFCWLSMLLHFGNFISFIHFLYMSLCCVHFDLFLSVTCYLNACLMFDKRTQMFIQKFNCNMVWCEFKASLMWISH